MTPLNRAVSAAHKACLAADTHRAGTEVTVPRATAGGYFEFSICDTCGVPVAPRFSWRLKWTDWREAA